MFAAVELDDAEFQRFVAEAIALRGGKPLPVFEDVDDAVEAGPFSRSGLYVRGPTGTGEIEFRKVGSRTKVRTLSRLRAAARLPKVSPQSANRADPSR